jgi:hypothetical protein
MAAADDLRILNDALSQADRIRAAPAPARVKVDGRSLADLLAFAADYGRLITFYDLANHPNGDWSAFFANDPSIALAVRASLDPDVAQSEFDRLFDALREATDFTERLGRLRALAAAIVRLARILDPAAGGSDDLDKALTRLAASDRLDLLAAPARSAAMHLGADSLENGLRRDRGDWYPQAVERLGALVEAMLTALEQGQAGALAALEASFDNPSHPPQSGLYDAFAKLFGHAQQSINRFPARLVEFYRARVLRQTGRPATPDSLSLTFTPAKGVPRAELARGTRFLAGTDSDGESIAYALDSALSVDAASIAALSTLTVTREAPWPDAPPIPARVLTGVAALSETAPAIAAPFPLFGATTTGTSGVLTTVEATLGFAVSSATLMLTGGTRSVNIGLTLAPGSLAELEATLQGWGEAAGLPAQEVFRRLLEAAFHLRYSTAGGWVDIPSYVVTPCAADCPLFTLRFDLDPDADPFVALSTGAAAGDPVPAAASGAAPSADLPTLIASLAQDPVTLGRGVTVYPYALLSGMQLSKLSVGVEVGGLADVQASTPAGPVDPSQPFLVFGSPPVQGATLDLAAPELFVKPVDDFWLTIQWFGLPVTTTGFKGYYRAYVVNADGNSKPPPRLDNQSFTASLSVVNPGLWSIRDSSHYLFRTALCDSGPPPDGPVEPETLFDTEVEAQSPPPYYDPGSSAIRLRLAEPDTAFGDVLYAANVMAASVRLTAIASACAQKCGKPSSPEDSSSTLAPAIAANASAPEKGLDRAVGAAVRRTVADLDGAALKAIDDAIAASDAEPSTKEDWRDSLAAALRAPRPASLLRRIIRWFLPKSDFAAVHSNLSDWLAANASGLSPSAAEPLAKAAAMIAAGSEILEVQAEGRRQPAAVARPMVGAGLRGIEARLAAAPCGDTAECIRNCMKGADPLGSPNQPWLPMAAGISIAYNAAVAIPPAEAGEAAAPATFFHLLPFDRVEAVAWSGGEVPLLAPVESPAALFVNLSQPAEQLKLLFRLVPPASGWPTDTAPIAWAQSAGAAGWTPLSPLRDTTRGLSRTGIVDLTLAEAAADWLRVTPLYDPEEFPMLAGVATNAATASWVGPGGASRLGSPLAAGTVTGPESPLPDLGTVDQPLPSSGGTPPEQGSALEMWLAERLRHKDRGIDPWDYSSLLLAGFPSLWQAAVVPASDGGPACRPGHVWIVAVPGPGTANVADPTIPSNDSTMLADMAAYLGSRISPFIQLTLTNPPYRRVTVVADLAFTDTDSVEANIERLNEELIDYLSPWPPEHLPPRPDDYFTLEEVAHFIRHRPYVHAILSLRLVADVEVNAAEAGWHYLTSALSHRLRGTSQAARTESVPPILSLSRRPHRPGASP